MYRLQRLTVAGGTFQCDTDGTFYCDIPGTFQSVADGTFYCDMGGTFGPLLSFMGRILIL